MTSSDEPVCLLTEDEIVASLQNTANLLSARRVLLEAAQFLDNTNRTAQHFNLTTQVDNYEQATKEYEQTTETTVMLQHFTKTVDQSIILNHVLREDLNSSSASSQSQVKVLFNSNQLEGLITHLNDNEGAEKEAIMKCNIENKMKISETLPRLRNLFVKTEKDEEKIGRFNAVNKYLKKMEIMRNITQRLLADCSWKEVTSDPKLREIHLRTLKRKTLADYYRQSEVTEVITDTSGVTPVIVEEQPKENGEPVEDDDERMSHPVASHESRADTTGAVLGNISTGGKTRNASFRSRVGHTNTTMKSGRNHTFRSGLLDGTRTTRNEVSGIALLNLNDTESSVRDGSLNGSAVSYEQNQSLDGTVRRQEQNESVQCEVSLDQSEENVEQSVISSRIGNRSQVSRLEESVGSQESFEDNVVDSQEDESLEEKGQSNESLYQSVYEDQSSENELSNTESTPEESRVRSRNFGNASRISAHSSRKRGNTLPKRRSPIREERMETSSDEEYYEASEDAVLEKLDKEEEIEDEEAIEDYKEDEYGEEEEAVEDEENVKIDYENEESEDVEYEEENELNETESVEYEDEEDTDLDNEEKVDHAEPDDEEELEYDEIEDEEVVDHQVDESYEDMDEETADDTQDEEAADQTYPESFENDSNDSIMTSISQMPENDVWDPAGPYQAPLGYVPPVYAPYSGAMNPIFGYRPSMGAPALANYGRQYEAYDENEEDIEYEEENEFEEESEYEEDYDMREERAKVVNPKKVPQKQKVQEKGKKKGPKENKRQKKVLQEQQPTQPSKTRRKR